MIEDLHAKKVLIVLKKSEEKIQFFLNYSLYEFHANFSSMDSFQKLLLNFMLFCKRNWVPTHRKQYFFVMDKNWSRIIIHNEILDFILYAKGTWDFGMLWKLFWEKIVWGYIFVTFLTHYAATSLAMWGLKPPPCAWA